MATLSLLRENLAEKTQAIDDAEARLRATPADATSWLRRRLAGEEFVLFCGAGISIPPPASAPSFVELRNSVVLALVDLLEERRLIDRGHRTAMEAAVEELADRADLDVPPEHVFGLARNALGFDVVSRLLARCLDHGEANENHQAIRRLIGATGPRLTAVITPNFDLYIERALERIAVRRTVADTVEAGDGFPLYKPHGSLDCPDSIAITIDRVARPLRGTARRTFEELTAGRTVIVIGYSGFDYDLFPLLVHAGRAWDATVVWLLYDDASMNGQAAGIQLALEARCTILNCRRRPVLPVLAGLGGRPNTRKREDLRSAFANILSAEPDDALASALIGLVTPSGTPDSAGVVRRLCAELLRMAESHEIEDDANLLQRLGQVVAWSDDDLPRQRRAAQLAVECAVRLGREPAVRAFQRVEKGEEESESAESRLRRVERDLREFPFAFDNDPVPELGERSIRTDLRISQAALLMDVKRESEAERLARQILNDTTFPESGVSEDAWIASDGHLRWKLHSILGSTAAHRGDTDEAQAQFCEALDVLWQELELWELDSALHHVAYEAAGRDRECVEAAMDLSVRIARFGRDPYSELYALEWKLDYAVGTPADVERAEELLGDVKLNVEDQRRHMATLQRLRKRVR